jgi:hypothetical protein
MVRRVARLLDEKLGGEALTELAIITPDGVKVPDAAWYSKAFIKAHFLALGATEAWLVSDAGVVEIHTSGGRRDDSTFGFNPASLLSNQLRCRLYLWQVRRR